MFLRSAEQQEIPDKRLFEEEVNTELRSGHVTVQFNNMEPTSTDPLLKLEKYSEKNQGELTAEELADAERYWILEMQNQVFRKERDELRAGKDIHRGSRIRDLKPFLDEHGLICLGGRLQHSDMSFSERHPYILPSDHRLSEMLIRQCHDQVMYSGTRDTLMQLRDKYWIPRARQITKKNHRSLHHV